MRFDPFREMDRIAQMASEAAQTPRSFPLDAYRRGEEFILQFDLPGVDASSIELTVERNVLTVKGERRFARQEGDEIIAAERPQGIFTRQLFLGDTLDGERISAEYHDGVLTLTIPISERAKPRKVEISTQGRPQTVEARSGQHSAGNGSQQGEMAESSQR
ncbi:MAG TPA: Hsp20/alpha crystallin family protein [Solirubrobacteraceae bacterium]|nr:Hsp20/alpha crystallin family protein [Solirubrobacteraceae bacterium]